MMMMMMMYMLRQLALVLFVLSACDTLMSSM